MAPSDALREVTVVPRLFHYAKYQHPLMSLAGLRERLFRPSKRDEVSSNPLDDDPDIPSFLRRPKKG